MYETEEELNHYFGNNKKRVFTVKVTVTDDKVISLKKQIDITFVALESNTNISTYTE